MTARHVDPHEVLSELKDFQRDTAVWAFQRMFDVDDPALRFLVADEVGLGKTHVAKGVIAQVIDHLQQAGDTRHDIVYVCSNAAIARQNLRKLVPKGIEPLDDVERLTMLPLARLDHGGDGTSGVNLLAITPGTSLKFGQNTGQFPERCLAYAFLRALWGPGVMNRRARWIFWKGITAGNPDQRLRTVEKSYRPSIRAMLPDFADQMEEADRDRRARGQQSLRRLFDEIVDGLAWQRAFPDELDGDRKGLIGAVRRIMAIVGIAALGPDLVVLDEFQRFKDLLQPDPTNFAADLAHRLFNFADPESGRETRTLLLSATPYRMYTTADEVDGDHYADFVSTCAFLFGDPHRVGLLDARFGALRAALTTNGALGRAEEICAEIGADLRSVIARTERLAATPDRDGMLRECDATVSVEPDDLRAYARFGNLAEAVQHHEPSEYWKAGPYLVNFMEKYNLKQALGAAALAGVLPEGERLGSGPGLLNWDDVEAYAPVDPQNGRLRWLLDDLAQHRAFELLWIPPSLRYYDAGSVYESDEALSFTKRLIFSGWAFVPKVVSSLVSLEAERRAYAARSHTYTTDYRRRGGQRLSFRTEDRKAMERRPGTSDSARRAAAMTALLFCWPSVTLGELGDPRPRRSTLRPRAGELLEETRARVASMLESLTALAPADGPVDQRWYWAAPMFLDARTHPPVSALLRAGNAAYHWEEDPGAGLLAHLDEARAMLDYGPDALGRPPEDLDLVLAELALGGPAQCALRALSAVTGLAMSQPSIVSRAARIAAAFRSFFNAPEVTSIVVRQQPDARDKDDASARYWRDAVGHCIDGNLQAVLDEHAHVLRDWLGHLDLADEVLQRDAADSIAKSIADALEVRTSSFRVDIPRPGVDERSVSMGEHRMRTRFAVAFGNQTLDDGGVDRVESVSTAFNSPFWPFVLTSTSVGQEGLDFHLWCHAVVHWNLPANPVDMEQREGRVHRYKGHAVRRNIACSFASSASGEGVPPGSDPWAELFKWATADRRPGDGEMVPYWVFNHGPAKIERHVPVLPFSRETVRLPRLRKTLAAYRLAFGQPRQEELIEFLGADRSDDELLSLASRLRIDLSPPAQSQGDVTLRERKSAEHQGDPHQRLDGPNRGPEPNMVLYLPGDRSARTHALDCPWANGEVDLPHEVVDVSVVPSDAPRCKRCGGGPPRH